MHEAAQREPRAHLRVISAERVGSVKTKSRRSSTERTLSGSFSEGRQGKARQYIINIRIIKELMVTGNCKSPKKIREAQNNDLALRRSCAALVSSPSI